MTGKTPLDYAQDEIDTLTAKLKITLDALDELDGIPEVQGVLNRTTLALAAIKETP